MTTLHGLIYDLDLDSNQAIIFLHCEITSEIADDFLKLFLELEKTELKEIHISILSGGGSVEAGYNIITAIKNSTKKIITINSGFAFSIAGVIFLAGEIRYALDFALWMCHLPWSENESESNIALEKIAISLSILLSHSFKNVDTLQMMKDETWLDANEMYSADLILEPIQTEYKIELEKEEKPYFENNIYNNIKNSITHDMNFLRKIKNESKLEVLETVETEVKNEVEVLESETEKETVLETVLETETIVESEIKIEDSELEILKAEIEKLKLEIESKSTKEIEFQNLINEFKTEKEQNLKLEILNSCNIPKDAYDKWLKLDLDVVKNLAPSVKVNATPNFSNLKEVENSVNVKNMSFEQKQEFAKSDPKGFAKATIEANKRK